MSAEHHHRRLQQRFGGDWDGTRPEIHGLIEHQGIILKIEILYVERRSFWMCSVFRRGDCVASERANDPIAAVERGLARMA